MAKTAQERPYMTPKEVAAELMVTPETVRLWVQKGLLQADLTAGGHRRFKREEIDAFTRRRHGRAANAPIRVLIVDDEQQMVDMLVAVFESAATPMTTESASSGFEAGRKVASFRPDVVLLNIMMPGINGFEVCEQIAREKGRSVRVIGMTGFHSTENAERMRAAGAIACLPKPLNFEQLEQLISAQVGVHT